MHSLGEFQTINSMKCYGCGDPNSASDPAEFYMETEMRKDETCSNNGCIKGCLDSF